MQEMLKIAFVVFNSFYTIFLKRKSSETVIICN